MIQTRERKIIEALLIACIAAGFACFALVILPQQTSRAGGAPTLAARHAGISSIVDLAARGKRAEGGRHEGIFARFVPEGSTEAAPAGGLQGQPGEAPPPEIDEMEGAGGAGVAIDDGGEESMLAYDRPQAAASPMAAPEESDLAPGDPYGDSPAFEEAARQGKASGKTRLVVHPQSSIALGAPAAIDSASGRRRMAWLATPDGFEADVAFWRDIYSRYDKNFVVLHHPRHLGIVYDVVDLGDIERNPRINDIEREHMRKNRVDGRRDAIVAVLEKLATSPVDSTLSSEEMRIKGLFAGVNEPDRFKRAAREDGVRGQLGQSDKFIAGLAYSNRYMGEIERIFAAHGLPVELTRLIFVESMFMTQARSSAGASGIWQFMRGTGKRFLRINEIYDERNDPIASTHAAARLLAQNYRELGSWPLAINAYNAGRGRIAQAVAQLGTRDIARIMREFKHPGYAFASRNFFLEFLAAYDVVEHHERHFGNIKFDEPLRYEEVSVDYHVSLPQMAEMTRIPFDLMAELNPMFSRRAMEGVRLVPAGTAVRVPEGKGEFFISLASRATKSRRGPVHHVVQDGETMASIADIYGVTPAEIMKQNRIGRGVHRGQTLKIPVR
ncbi:MAG: transglycosylase SLT domain-containing protein [Proteobacteria bacterium]|nr:transglycosylase SLT domain-containing protein [Pseudomonadota bacterium]